MARALHFQAKLSIKFWGTCILTVAYLINLLSTRVLSNKSSYEVLFDKPPKYDHLRVFGCLCYAQLHSPIKDKFGPHFVKCVFIGYPHEQKGYRAYNLASK